MTGYGMFPDDQLRPILRHRDALQPYTVTHSAIVLDYAPLRRRPFMPLPTRSVSLQVQKRSLSASIPFNRDGPVNERYPVRKIDGAMAFQIPSSSNQQFVQDPSHKPCHWV